MSSACLCSCEQPPRGSGVGFRSSAALPTSARSATGRSCASRCTPTEEGRSRRPDCRNRGPSVLPRVELLFAQRWHEPGPPPLSARDSRELTSVGALEEAPMAIVAEFDVHRAQITFDALDQRTGEVERGRIRATPEAVRRWAARFAGKEVHVAVEACTGWLFVCEALVEAGAIPHLAEPVETSALRGRKRRAKTDREDARWLRTLLCDGRLPEAWIPPAHVREWRTRARLRKTLVDERTRWLVRVQATLFHDGVGGCAGQAARAPRAARSSPGSSCPRRPGSGSGWRFR